MSRKKLKEIYRYKCTLSGREYKTTRKAKNPDDLMSVSAWYEMNQEHDDRPERIKLEVKMNESSYTPSAMPDDEEEELN